jgi:hypothetical protein
MTGIKHHIQSSIPNDPQSEVSSDAWNEAHDKGDIADVLLDHTKLVHDALGINAATLETHASNYFAVAEHTHNSYVAFAVVRSNNFLRL